MLIAEIAPTDTGSFEALITHCGGTILDFTYQQLSACRLVSRRSHQPAAPATELQTFRRRVGAPGARER